MNSIFTIKGTGMSFEQDVHVTEQTVKDVKLEVGDEVNVLLRARVARVYGDGGEVDLENPQPVKIVQVFRQGRRRRG